ncbi:DsbA family protein [Ktedonobacter sp. SOSP1-85]|uniref:DsbA family oxidoreductase n=1 Tax=Ktedonobacter sp. SOSP1-85 TaxID=2778367 RepID=UPI001916B349|nr:DsbA family protein [Ktedonobacter sp. SOSP1-85]
MNLEATQPKKVNMHVDPLCPLAWRTALWMRNVRQERPVDITWKLFSLEVVNRQEGVQPDYVNGRGWTALRTLALARRQKGNEALEKLYVALGNAAHGRKENINERSVVEAAAQEAGLGSDFVAQALADESTVQEVLNDHKEAVDRYAAFGVPTIAFEGSTVGFYGPVIHSVPEGEEAATLWDHTSYFLTQPNVFELKRDRVQAPSWEPVSAK